MSQNTTVNYLMSIALPESQNTVDYPPTNQRVTTTIWHVKTELDQDQMTVLKQVLEPWGGTHRTWDEDGRNYTIDIGTGLWKNHVEFHAVEWDQEPLQ